MNNDMETILQMIEDYNDQYIEELNKLGKLRYLQVEFKKSNDMIKHGNVSAECSDVTRNKRIIALKRTKLIKINMVRFFDELNQNEIYLEHLNNNQNNDFKIGVIEILNKKLKQHIMKLNQLRLKAY
jgi:hypothetical protein